MRMPLLFNKNSEHAKSPPESNRFGSSLQFKFSRLTMIFWMFMATQSFVPTYLLLKGFSSIRVGTVTAMISLLGILSPPIWGMLADKIKSSKKTYLICLSCATVFIALVPIAGEMKIAGILLMTVLLPIIQFFRIPSDSIMNNWIMRISQRHDRMDYGSIRPWGSFGYAMMCTLYYFLMRMYSPDAIFIIPLILIIPIVYFAMKLPDSHENTTENTHKEKLHPARLFKNYYYMAFLVFIFLLSIPLFAIFVFRTYLIVEVGGDPAIIGLIIGVKILCEVPTMVMSRRLINRFRPPVVLLFVGAIFLTEHFLYTICATTLQVILVQMIQSLGNGLYIPTFVNYINKIAPKELTATAQSIQAMVRSTGGIVASLLGGWAIGAFGIRTLFLITFSMMLLAVVFFVLSFVFGQKVLKIEPPVPLFRTKNAQ